MVDAEHGGENHFGAELRAHRLRRKWTQAQLGEKIGFSDSFVSDVERGGRTASLDFAQRCDEVFDLPETFVRAHEITKRAAFAPWFYPVLPFEEAATRIHGWELGAVPGLLQTERYARAVVRARLPGDDEASIERIVAARMERQELLDRDRPPLLWYVLHEGLARHVVGDSGIMGEQLDKLIKSAERPGVVLQVLPFTANDHAGVEGPIVVYERQSGSPVAYTECYGGGRIVEGPEEVADLTTVVGMLRASALAPRDSVALLREIRRDLE